MSHLVIIGGPNGAGKSTAAPALLKNALNLDNFVNADVIAQGLCAYNPEKVSIQAGRLMLNRIHNLASEDLDFAF
jgi:predicted ABC-type ATPase